MKIDWSTVVTVLIAMLVWKLLVDPMVDRVLPNGVGIGNYEEEE